MEVIEDVVSGAQYREGREGRRCVRQFRVRGLSSRSPLFDAASARDPVSGVAVPRYLEPHPVIPGLFVADVDVKPCLNSRSQARVTVTYESLGVRHASGSGGGSAPAGGVVVRGASSSEVSPTQFDADGAEIVVYYRTPTGRVLREYGQVQALEDHTILEFVREEPASPLLRSMRFRRRVNAAPWQGAAAGAWLCRQIEWESLANDQGYRVRYAFEYREAGHEKIVVFIDRATGRPPADIEVKRQLDRGMTQGNGWKKVRLYDSADFNALGLPSAL